MTDLPEPELADERQRLALVDRKRDAIDGERLPAALHEGDGEVADVEER